MEYMIFIQRSNLKQPGVKVLMSSMKRIPGLLRNFDIKIDVAYLEFPNITSDSLTAHQPASQQSREKTKRGFFLVFQAPVSYE